MKKPTSKDVAKLAGVSQSTVSFVLNNKNDVSISPETRAKVFEAAKKLNYVPNIFGKGLRTNRSMILGLMIPTITNPYYPMLTQQIEEYASNEGYNIILCNTYRNKDKEEFYLNLLLEKAVDGIIYGFTPNFSELLNKISKTVPIVIIGEKDDSVNISTVGLNSFRAGEMTVQHLIELGHKKIAFITSPLTNISLSRERRLKGIISKLKEYHLDKNLIVKAYTSEYEITDSTYEIEIGYELAIDLIKETDVTAIIGVNDMVAFGAMNAILNQGLKIPDDISICGFDNIYLSRLIKPKMTTIDHHITHRSKLAFDLLLKKIAGEEDSILRIEYEPKLVIRESTGPSKQ